MFILALQRDPRFKTCSCEAHHYLYWPIKMYFKLQMSVKMYLNFLFQYKGTGVRKY